MTATDKPLPAIAPEEWSLEADERTGCLAVSGACMEKGREVEYTISETPPSDDGSKTSYVRVRYASYPYGLYPWSDVKAVTFRR